MKLFAVKIKRTLGDMMDIKLLAARDIDSASMQGELFAAQTSTISATNWDVHSVAEISVIEDGDDHEWDVILERSTEENST